MESYADIYSGLVVYLKNDNKNIFEQIKTFRENSKNKIKEQNPSFYGNQVNKGKFATTEYFNFYGVEKFKDNFINNFEKEDILKISKSNFEAIHHIIQTEALDGLYKTMKEEAKNNDLFLLELKDFCQSRHKCSINDFFDNFESHLTNLRSVYCKYSPINTLDNNAQPFNYDMKCSQLTKNDIIQQYRETLKKEDLIKFDNAGISELKLNCFDDHYKIQSNYSSPNINIDLASKNKISENIFSLREKFLEQKTHTKSLNL